MSLHGVDSEGLPPTNTLQVASKVAVKMLGLRRGRGRNRVIRMGEKLTAKEEGNGGGRKEK